MKTKPFEPTMYAVRSFCCVLAAVGIGLCAPLPAARATNSTGSMQALVNDTVAQLRLSYRHDPAARQDRYARLAEVMHTWRRAPRSDANNQRLAEWLRAAMRASMPGSRAPLPSMPEFEGGPADERHSDPFVDDRLQE